MEIVPKSDVLAYPNVTKYAKSVLFQNMKVDSANIQCS